MSVKLFVFLTFGKNFGYPFLCGVFVLWVLMFEMFSLQEVCGESRDLNTCISSGCYRNVSTKQLLVNCLVFIIIKFLSPYEVLINKDYMCFEYSLAFSYVTKRCYTVADTTSVIACCCDTKSVTLHARCC